MTFVKKWIGSRTDWRRITDTNQLLLCSHYIVGVHVSALPHLEVHGGRDVDLVALMSGCVNEIVSKWNGTSSPVFQVAPETQNL